MRLQLRLSRPAVFATCRLYFSHLNFLFSLLSKVTLFLQTQHNAARVYKPRPGSAPLQSCSRDAQRSFHPAHYPAVLTGRSLGFMAHQHFGYRMHFDLEGAFGTRCLERRFPSYDSLSHFCVTWINGTPEGLCTCTIVREEIHENGVGGSGVWPN